MPKYRFYKYQGAGNDFVIFDGRGSDILGHLNEQTISWICDRRFGIGGDGLMVLGNHIDFDFEMIYYNSDGKPSSMCGNGGRCLVAFAEKKGVIDSICSFIAVDGPHKAKIVDGIIELQMNDVHQINKANNDDIIDTGSPHFIRQVKDLHTIDIITEAHQIRYNDRFAKDGINVNFCHFGEDGLSIRTYERGVEAETLACGTGATAAAISYVQSKGLTGTHVIPVQAVGGKLSVKLTQSDQGYTDLWLCGPGEYVFEGEIDISRS